VHASPIPFDAIPVAGILLRLDGTIVALNPAAWLIVGNTLVDHTLRGLHPALGARWELLVERVRAHGQATEDVELVCPGGTRHLQVVLSFVDLAGETLVQGYAMDVTALHLTRSAGAEADARLAGQRLDSLGLVAGGIAHDFNNLLVGVLAEASAAREDVTLGEAAREALRRIEAAARRMAQLTRQLLAYSGRAQLVTIPVAADELLGELRESLDQLAGSGRLTLETHASGLVVEADPNLLRQVVLNLVTNAADAGATRVAVTSKPISRDGTPFWQLEIADDGAGITAATLDRIFEPFYSTKPGHHGLGLSAVHGIVRRLGGDIEVESRKGHGTRFRVHLPVALGAEPKRASRDAVAPIPKLEGVRVLVADDEPSVRATVRRLLERRGAQVVVVSDGAEAEQQLTLTTFDLVVSDVAMPGRTGYDVLATARALQPAARVVLMSGYTEKLRGQGGEDEPDGFLEKPFTAKSLDAMLDEVRKR
jgi:two-component system, cell cycle sensor histidine kinase and response regulator CckA